jgi:hypothetical protein
MDEVTTPRPHSHAGRCGPPRRHGHRRSRLLRRASSTPAGTRQGPAAAGHKRRGAQPRCWRSDRRRSDPLLRGRQRIDDPLSVARPRRRPSRDDQRTSQLKVSTVRNRPRTATRRDLGVEDLDRNQDRLVGAHTTAEASIAQPFTGYRTTTCRVAAGRESRLRSVATFGKRSGCSIGHP